MDLTVEKMGRLASQAASEQGLLLKILWVACDSNLLWRVVYSGQSNLIVIVFVDTHDLNNEQLIRNEIKKQLSHHVTVRNLAPLKRPAREDEASR
jgi:hypothetical protein